MRALDSTTVPAPISTSPSITQYGPISASAAMLARLPTVALGWMLMPSAARGLVRCLGRFDAADEIGDRPESTLTHVLVESGIHLLRRERIVEERRAEPDRGRAREQELER